MSLCILALLNACIEKLKGNRKRYIVISIVYLIGIVNVSHPNPQDAYLAPPSVVTHVLGNTPFPRDGKLLQIYLGDRREENWVKIFMESSGINLSYTAMRLRSHSLIDFTNILNDSARQFGVIVLSPSHSNSRALYYLSDGTVDDDEKITLDDLISLKGKVDLRNAIIILDACINVELAPVFVELGAKAVYGHTKPDFGVDFYAIFQHMQSGTELPSDLEYVTKRFSGFRSCEEDL